LPELFYLPKSNSIILSKQFTLGKKERLKSRKKIDLLFKQGQRMNVTPLRVFYLINKADELSKEMLQFGAGASSRFFKRAVDRNRIKRLLREAYRLQKIPLQNVLKSNDSQLAIFIIYTGKELPEYKEIEQKMAIVLDKLSSIIHPVK
jgi:ribonuclease P protein component